MNCRHCGKKLNHTFLNLGFAPASNAYLRQEDLSHPETYYPLKVNVCNHCWLVQTEDYAEARTLFRPDYAYFSSTSSSWLAHAAKYVEKVTGRLGLNKNSYVIEIASNDGYLLKNFTALDIPCLGIEPTQSTAAVAENIGISVLRDFFCKTLGEQLSSDGRQADLIIGNNVYAHVPDINDFTMGLKAALKHGGTITLEFPHIMKLIEYCQFDTVYHEHFSYLSLYTVNKIFDIAGLRVWDVEELPTHGGSLRIYGCHSDDNRETTQAVKRLLQRESKYGLQTLGTYISFQNRADKVKDDLVEFLIHQKRKGKRVIAYGAAAKGNTLLNYGGIKTDLLPIVCDAALAKQNKFMPGSHIPIYPPSELLKQKPDYILILPWNIASEVKEQLTEMTNKEFHYITAVPQMNIT